MLIDYMYIYLVALILSMFIATDFVETLVENLDQLFNFSVFLMGNLCNLAGYCLIWIEYHMCTIYPKEGSSNSTSFHPFSIPSTSFHPFCTPSREKCITIYSYKFEVVI